MRILRAGKWTFLLSNTVLGEYHEVLHRETAMTGLSHADTDAYLDALCALAEQCTLSSEW